MSVPVASTIVTILVSVRTMLDPSHVTVREDIEGTECGVQVKLLSFLVLSLFLLVENGRVPCFIPFFSIAILHCPFYNLLN